MYFLSVSKEKYTDEVFFQLGALNVGGTETEQGALIGDGVR